MDQNVPRAVAQWLRHERPAWRVIHVNELGLNGATDEAVFRWAQAEEAVIVTYDEDFADARTYPLGSHAGVVRLRVWPTTVEQTEAALSRLLASVPEEELPGSLVIIDPQRIRLRKQTPRR
ncbi:MAG: DUF5615 family PIN-like protein [Bryobacteraceae bacterium]